MHSLDSQVYSFIVIILTGITVGILFDLFGVTRDAIHPGKIVGIIGDIFFWITITVIIIFLLLVGNWGEPRLYILIGAAVGVYIYIRFLRVIVVRFLRSVVYVIKKTLEILLKVLRYIWITVTYPIVVIRKVIVVPIGYLGMAFTKSKTSLKKLTKQIFKKL
jgi:spore cortex biosynthesis protein YabQ